MSKNIVIQEGGVGRQMTASRLRTDLAEGGTCLWVPEDEVQLGKKTIRENGTFLASDEGLYGFSQVTVKGIGTVTGRKSDGNEYSYTADNNGNVVETRLPSEIRVIEPPENPYGIYPDGYHIDTAGMVVRAYLASGDEYGDVPVQEVSIDPDTAVYERDKDIAGGTVATSTLDMTDPWNWSPRGPVEMPVRFASDHAYSAAWWFNGSRNRWMVNEISAPGCRFITDRTGQYNLVASDDPSVTVTVRGLNTTTDKSNETVPPSLDDPDTVTRTYALNSAFTLEGRTVYYRIVPWVKSSYWGDIDTIVENTYPVDDDTAVLIYSTSGGVKTNFPPANMAWTLIYGDITEERAGSRQEIAVSWPRPGDGRTLETSFIVLVAPGYGGEE